MEIKESSAASFTSGPIAGPLIRFALPVLGALFLQTMYGAADLLIVGKFADAAAISAVSTGTMILQSITSVIVGIAVGTTVLIGQSIGEGRADKASEIVGGSIALFALIGLAVALLMQPLSAPVAKLMQAPPEAFDATVSYVRICCGGAVFIVAYNVLGSVFRGMGDSKLPLITVAIASVANIFGDLLLVAVFHMGAAGAAIATVFAQGLSVLLSYFIIRKRALPFQLSRADVRFSRPAIQSVLKLGWPIALQDLLVSLSFLAITAIVNGLGVLASAGVGVAERVCSFIMLVPSAFAQSMSAFVAQNAGARRFDRANTALRCGIAISLAVGVVMGYTAFFRGDLLAGVFAKDAAVIANASAYLKAYAIDCLLVSFLFCFIGYFNGVGKTNFVMVQGLIGAFGVRIPVSYLMSRIAPVSLFRIGLATPSSTAVQIALCFIAFLRLKRKQFGSPETEALHGSL